MTTGAHHPGQTRSRFLPPPPPISEGLRLEKPASPATEVLRALDKVVEAADPADRPDLALALTARLGALAARMAKDKFEEQRLAHAEATGEHLLSVDEAAAIIGGGVDKDWVFRHTKGQRFRRGFSRKAILFEEGGLRRWIASRR